MPSTKGGPYLSGKRLSAKQESWIVPKGPAPADPSLTVASLPIVDRLPPPMDGSRPGISASPITDFVNSFHGAGSGPGAGAGEDTPNSSADPGYPEDLDSPFLVLEDAAAGPLEGPEGSPIPEPGTLTLLGSGLLLIGFLWRLRRR